jgi:protease-4
MIDTSYQQFVATVAQARQLAVETVKSFADGRIFTGQQALELGVVDRLGSEEDARRWAAELAGLDPEKAQSQTIEEPKPLLNRILGGRNQSKTAVGAAIDWVEFELATSGQPLWLYRP